MSLWDDPPSELSDEHGLYEAQGGLDPLKEVDGAIDMDNPYLGGEWVINQVESEGYGGAMESIYRFSTEFSILGFEISLPQPKPKSSKFDMAISNDGKDWDTLIKEYEIKEGSICFIERNVEVAPKCKMVRFLMMEERNITLIGQFAKPKLTPLDGPPTDLLSFLKRGKVIDYCNSEHNNERIVIFPGRGKKMKLSGPPYRPLWDPQ
ncbi:hypothetical protein L0F63_002350 [Massospora cicadina]|nr:hypothetical protein L0F63_002350 [Massospora cicadina]